MAPSRGGAGAALLALLAAVLVCLLQTTTTVQAATTLQTPGDTFEAAFEVSWTPRREGPRGRHWPPRSRRPPASVTPTPLASLTHELSRISPPPGWILSRETQAPNRRDLVRTDRLPRRSDSSHFSGSTTFAGGRSDQSLSYDFTFLPLFGPSKGKTPVEVQVTGVFPTGVHTAYCHFGRKTTPVVISRAKRHHSRAQTIRFTCYSPPGRGGGSVPVSVSINDLTLTPQSSQRFYYYAEPKVLEVSPESSDLQGGTLVTVYTSHDVFAQAFGQKSKDFYEQNPVGRAAVSNIKCAFDGKTSVGLRTRTCGGRPCFVCISPSSRDVGRVEVSVSPNGLSKLASRGHFTYEDLNYEPGSIIVGVASEPHIIHELGPNGQLYGMLEDPGAFYELHYPGSRYVPGVFYDENYYDFYGTTMGRHEAQFCVSSLKTNVGPVSGGTVVTLSGRGSVTAAKEEFYCVFGASNFVRASSVQYSFENEAYEMSCAAPAASQAGDVQVGVSLNGIQASQSGLTYTYHEPADAVSVSPATVPSEGGTSVEVSLASNVDALESRSCVCRFKVSVSQSYDAQGSFDSGTQKVTCEAPGVSTDLDETAVEVSVSFNGADFGSTAVLVTQGKTTAGFETETTNKIGFYGLFEGLLETMVPVPAVSLVAPVAPSLSLTSSVSYSDDYCVHFTTNSLAILTGLELFGVTQTPSLGEEIEATVLDPLFEMDSYEYQATVSYEVHSLALRGVGADTYSSVFVDGVVVPTFGVSDDIPLVVGQNTIEVEVHSSDGLFANVYAVHVTRLAQRTDSALVSITATDADGTSYALSPSFDSGTLSYTVQGTVPYHSSFLSVGIAHEDDYGLVKASVRADKSDETEIGHSAQTLLADLDLSVGGNTVTLVSLAQDRGVSRTYKLSVDRAPASTDTTFKKMEVKTGRGTEIALSPAFDPSVTSYTASVRYTDTFSMELETANARATYSDPDGVVRSGSGSFTKSLPVGETELTFEVTGQDGVAKRSYVVRLTRMEASSDARLGAIATRACSDDNQANVEPNFDKDTDVYSAKVFFECNPSGESDAMGSQFVSVSATCHDELCSKIRIYEPKGDRWLDAGTSGAYITLELNGNPLQDVTNAVLIEVTAEDDVIGVSTTKTYTLNAIRTQKDANANLLSLQVHYTDTDGNSVAGVLHRNSGEDVLPAFDKTIHEYWMEVENAISSVKVTAQVESKFALLKVGIVSPASLASVSNGTESQVLSLPTGTTTTVIVEALSQRYQPNESVEGYDASTTTAGSGGTTSRIITHIHVFRRTKSTDASLSSLVLGVDGPASGITSAMAPTFATGTTSGYAMSVRYYIGKLNITGTCPDTASPVSYRNHAPRCSIAVAGASGTSGNVVQTSLVSGANTVQVVVTAEDGTTTKTYEVTVTRETPKSDSTLSSLSVACAPLPTNIPPSYQTAMDSALPSCWLSKTPEGGDPAQNGYDQQFTPSHTTYYLRTQHRYMYHQAVVTPDVQSVDFTAAVTSRVDSIPVATMALNGATLADSAASGAQALQDAPASGFPSPVTTTFSIVVTAEDGTTTTYAVHAVKAAVEPSASEWVKRYHLNDYGNKTIVDLANDDSIVAGTHVPFSLEVNTAGWEASVASALGSLSGEYAPISAMEFQPVVSLVDRLGSPATVPSPAAALLPLGGLCASGTQCLNSFCPLQNGTLTTTRCSKTVPLAYVPEVVGVYTYAVQAYGQGVNMIGSSTLQEVKFSVIHAAMSLNLSKIVAPGTGEGLVGHVSQPGQENVYLQAYDIFGNIILDNRPGSTYDPEMMEALLCPPDTVATNVTWDPLAKAEPGYEGYCRCGPATGCSVPSRGVFLRDGDKGMYKLEILTLVSGVNKIYMTADFGGLPINGGPGGDYHAQYPVPLLVSTNPIGTRSKLVFNTTVKPVVGAAATAADLPSFLVAAYDQYSNKIEKGGDLAVISLEFDPPLTSGHNVTDKQDGSYEVVVNTTVAADYKVTLKINGAVSVGSPFLFTVFSDEFSDLSTASFPAQTLAGTRTTFAVQPRDKFGNAIEFASPHGSVGSRLSLEVKDLATNIVKVADQEVTHQLDGTYLVNFTAPTNAFHNYALDVYYLHANGTKLFTLKSSDSHSNLLDIQGSYPNPDKSLYYVRGGQKAGGVVLGVVGVDDYGNQSPHFWSKWSASLDLAGPEIGPVIANATSAIYSIAEAGGGSIQVPFGPSVNVSGTYDVKFYYDGVEVDSGKVENSTTTVIPADIGSHSIVSKIPETTSLGQLVVVDILAYDSYGNEIKTGGETSGMAIKVYKMADPTDVVSHEVVDNGDGTYQAKFSPARSGMYVFDISYASGGAGSNQTFDVKFEFALPEHFEAVIPAKVDADVEATVVIQPVPGVDLSAASKSLITASLRDESGASKPLELSAPDGDARRTLKILETSSGSYLIDVLLEGKHVGSSPYNITVHPRAIATTQVKPMNQTTYYSDDDIVLDIVLRDQYDNLADVDIANDISVKYYQLPEGLIVEAGVEKTAAGYRAATKLTLAASYSVQVIVKGVKLCVEGSVDCVPSVTILPGDPSALTSLLEGNGLGKTIVAGVEGSVRVVPLDTYSNMAQLSKSQLMEYSLEIADENGTQITQDPQKLIFSSLDGSHVGTYVLTKAAKYVITVRQQDGLVVGGGAVNVEVVPSEVVVSKTKIEVATHSVAVGQTGSVLVVLRDENDNVIVKDLGEDLGLVLTNPSKVLSSSLGDVKLSFANGTYNATFSTTFAGSYEVSVQVFGVGVTATQAVSFVPEAPFALTTIARLAGNGLGVAGDKNVILIEGRDKYGNARTQEGGAYTVEVSVPDGTTTKRLFDSEITILWNDQLVQPLYQVEFVSTPKGIAFVEVKLGGVPVVGSPLTIDVSPASIDPAKCVLSGPGVNGGILNQETFFEIQSMDSFGNERSEGGDKFEVTVECTQATCPAVPVLVTDLGTGVYEVRYTLNSLGTFNLQVRLGMADVGLLPVQSPLVVTSKGTAGDINVMMSQVFGLSGVVEPGVEQAVTVIALDAEGFQLTTGGEKFVLSISEQGSPLTTKAEYESTDYLNGTYIVRFQTTKAGLYQVELQHEAKGVDKARTFVGTKSISYPVQVECVPGSTVVERSELVLPGWPATVPAGSFHIVQVQSADAFGNTQRHRDGSEDQWSVVGSPADSSLSLQVASTRSKASQPGRYDLGFRLPDVGLFNLRVVLKNSTGEFFLDGGVPVQVEGVPGGLAPSKVYTLDANKMPSVASATNLTKISFKPRDISGNVIPSLSPVPACQAALSPGDGQVVATCAYDQERNAFEVSFSSTKSGQKQLSITLNGEHIMESPFAFEISPATPVSATTTGIDFSGVLVNEKLDVGILPSDAFGNAIKSGTEELIVSIQDGSLSQSAFVENYGNGTYRARVQVQASGSFDFVVSKADGFVLLNQTLVVDPLPTSAALSFVQANDNFDGTKFRVAAGAVVQSKLVAISQDGNTQAGHADAFEVKISPDSAYLASVIDATAAASSVDGEYTFRFTTKRVLAEGYTVSVTLGSEHVKGSPFQVEVSPGAPSASQSNIYSGDYGYDASLGEFGSVAGVGRKFLLQLRDDYGNDLDQAAASSSGNKLEIEVDGAENVTTSVVGLPDGRFEMFYSVSLAGTHALQAKLSGVGVGGGSQILVVAGKNDFSKFNVYGPGITEDVIVGYTYHFNIEARDEFGNTRVDDGSTLGLLSVFMEARGEDRRTGALVKKAFDLVTVKYEKEASNEASSEKWLEGTFRVMFKTKTSGGIYATISACPLAGMSCSHMESDLDAYDVGASAIGSSPYTAAVAKPLGYVSSAFTGSGLQGGVLGEGMSATEPLPVVIEPLDAYGNVVELAAGSEALFSVSITPPTGMAASSIAALDDGFALNLTATATGNYFVDLAYNGSSITAQGPLEIPVYSDYPPVDPAQCVDFGEIFEECVVGETCTSNVQLYSEAKDPTCYTDQSTGGLMVLSTQRYAEIVSRPEACVGVFYPFTMSGEGGESYVTVLADSNRVNEISADGKGTYEAKMAFSISGLHTVETKVGPDPTSRWIQTITVPIGDGKTKIIKVFSSNTTELSVSTFPTLALAGEAVKVQIQPKDKFGNRQDYVAAIEDRIDLNYTSDTFLEFPSSLQKKRSTTSSIPFFYHEASYVPTKPGIYSGQLYHGFEGQGEPTPMSLPFALEVLPGVPDAASTVVTGLGVHGTVVNELGEIVVELRDQYGNRAGNVTRQRELSPSAFGDAETLQVAFAGSPPGLSFTKLVEYDPKKEAFETVYVSTKVGNFDLKVTVLGVEVVLNGYVSTAVTAGPISVASTVAEGPGVGDTGALSAGSPANFKILARDAHGNAILVGGAAFKCVIQSVVLSQDGINYVPDGRATTSAVPVDAGDGTYNVDFTLTLASYYHVEVTRGGQGIQGSPFLVQVLPGPTDAASSEVYCEPEQLDCPLETLEVGKQGKFYIQAKDRFGGSKADFADQFFYSVVGGGLSKSSFALVRDISKPGQYIGTFFTNLAGPVDLTVRLMGDLVMVRQLRQEEDDRRSVRHELTFSPSTSFCISLCPTGQDDHGGAWACLSVQL